MDCTFGASCRDRGKGRMLKISESRCRSQCESVERVYSRAEGSRLISQSALCYCVGARAKLELGTLVGSEAGGYDRSEQSGIFGQTGTNL